MSTHHADKGGQYIRLYVTMLTDVDLLEAGDLAFLGAVKLLLWSRQHREDGRVPATARAVQLIAQFDGGIDAAQTALDALLDIEFLVPTEDPKLLQVRTWDRYQSDLVKAREERAARTHRTNHAAGKHKQPREGCPDCSPAPAAKKPAAKKAAPETKTAAESPRKWTATQLRTEFAAAFPAVFADMSRLDGYRTLLAEAVSLAKANADLSENLEGNLKNAILEDALRHYIDADIDHKTVTACNRGAKALSDQDGHYWWILAAQASATQDWENEQHIIRWLTKVAASKRAEWLGGAE